MSGVDRETLERLRKLLEDTGEPVRQYLAGYAKGAMDAQKDAERKTA